MTQQQRQGRRYAQSPYFKIPFRRLRNRLPPLDFISSEQVEQIHHASMRILEEIGLDFLDDETLDLWQKAGAKVDHAARHVWLERGLVLELAAKAPPVFTWQARNPERGVEVGGNAITFAPNGGTVYASNLDIGRRPGTFEDYQNLLKLVQMSNVLHYTGEGLVAQHDVPVPARHLRRLQAIFTLSDKAAMAPVQGRIIANDSLEMARIVFGDPLPSNPVIGSVINVNSPLRYDTSMLGGLITFAQAGQVTIITPFILAGAMSPISLAAALAQQNAETLAGVALTQLVNPGAPVIYGGFTTNVDMKSGSPAFGTPEGAFALLIGGQLARRYKLPYRASGGLNTAKTPDAQAIYETQWSIWPAVLAHANYIFHSVGWLEGGLTASFEKFMIDQESLARFYHFLQDIEVNDDTLALDVIAKIGSGAPHSETSQPQARRYDQFYETFLSNRQNYESWLDEGGTDTIPRAYKLWQTVLAHYQPPPIHVAITETLGEYVLRREARLKNQMLYN